MSWIYEITLRGEPDQHAGLQAWLETGARETLAALPGLACLDLYTPADGPAGDPYNNDGAGPLMMLMLDFASRDALAATVAAGGIVAAAGALAPDIAATGTAFECRFYPVGGDTAPAPLLAPFSYVVRYHRPADDGPRRPDADQPEDDRRASTHDAAGRDQWHRQGHRRLR